MSTRTNIAIFASAFYPHIGGVEELCRQLARTYRQQGHGVVVVTNRWPRTLVEFEEHEGIPVYRVAMRVPDGSWKARLNYRLTHRGLRRKVVEALRRHQVNVVHVQCVSATAVYALEAKRRLGVPLVVSLQGELTMDASQLYQRSAYARGTMRDSLAGADAITACSSQTLREAEEFFGEPFGRRGQVIYNGIRLEDFEGAIPFEHPRPYILGIGRHVPQKGFDLLLRAYASAVAAGMTSHDLILAGDGTEHTALKELTSQLGLVQQVRFTGFADRPMAGRLFVGCDVFVLPSRHEPMGIVNLEAMACGKPVIATAVGGVPEIIVDGLTGLLVTGGDVAAMASAITRACDDPVLRDRLGLAGRQRAALFDWSKIADQYQSVYERVISGN